MIKVIITRIFFTLIFLNLLTTNVLAAPNLFDRMIVLGDSYSDNGNDFKLSQEKYPNAIRYFKGRFSDGPVWTEYFAYYFNLNPNHPDQFVNLAYGQAKILSPTTITVVEGNTKKTYPIPNLSQQIDMYLKQYKEFTSTDLVVIFISANDFFDVTAIDDHAFFKKMADEQAKQIHRMIKAGAQHIIVLNGRDVTYAPLAYLFAKDNIQKNNLKLSTEEWINRFNELIQVYNQRLASNLKNNHSVFLYNIYDFDNKIIQQMKQNGFRYSINGKKYTLKNFKSGCYQNNQGNYQDVAGPVCSDSEHYFFYDRIHTTKAVNFLLAKDVYQQFSKNK